MPSIDRNNLIDAGDRVKTSFAKGVFGDCKLKMYQGHLVISKEFKTGASKIDVVKEARVLQGISHPGLPIVLGVDLSKVPYIMVTLFYGIDKSKTTLQRVLDKENEAGMKLNKKQSLLIIKKLCETLMFLRSHSILHNDIKSDNVVLYKDEEGLKPILIDFGKACSVKEAHDKRLKKLSPETKRVYRERHSHIAPEIVEGIAAQSTATDVFSFGKVIIKIGKSCEDEAILKIGEISAQENIAKRCTLTFIHEECELLLKSQSVLNHEIIFNTTYK